MPVPCLSNSVLAVAQEMELFEAPKSRRNTGTGARREGSEFEKLGLRLWNEFSELCVTAGAQRRREPGAWFRVRGRHWHRHILDHLDFSGRTLVVPYEVIKNKPDGTTPPRWTETEYEVEKLVQHFPGEAVAIRDYSPATGPFAGDHYPNSYTGLTTVFDGTLVLIKDGVLHEKILLEYKTGKPTDSRNRVEGNAHERLSFQTMQYLELATRYTMCSLVVLANGAFLRYPNKYHVNFHIQADRLSNFSWFSMEYACLSDEYSRLLSDLLAWLFEGVPRSGRRAQ